jgi:SAM-dependent methyltransferase
MSETLAASGPRETYDAMAPFYDRFTAHHDYGLWSEVILGLARSHGLTGSRLLDVGCGTGKSFEPFLACGWRVTACDVSPRMLAIAEAKTQQDVELHLADVRRLPRYGEFDLVLLLDDVVNYLTEREDLVQAFAAAGANLADGGVLVFDVNLLRSYRTFFAETVVIEDRDCLLVWRGRTSTDAQAGVLSEAVLDAFERDPDGGWQRHVSVHRQRHHPEPVVRAALAEAGLECVGVYGHGLDGRPVEGADELRDTKALFIARRGAPGAERR